MTSVTPSQAREAVYERWNTNWSATTPFAFDGEQTDLNDGNESWARVFVRNTTSNQETLGRVGNRRYLRNATVNIMLHIPANQGMAELDTLMQTARNIFEGVSFGGLRFFDVNTQEIGSDGKWEMALVTAFFDYEETK